MQHYEQTMDYWDPTKEPNDETVEVQDGRKVHYDKTMEYCDEIREHF